MDDPSSKLNANPGFETADNDVWNPGFAWLSRYGGP
jgi:hypothetical protein